MLIGIKMTLSLTQARHTSIVNIQPSKFYQPVWGPTLVDSHRRSSGGSAISMNSFRRCIVNDHTKGDIRSRVQLQVQAIAI